MGLDAQMLAPERAIMEAMDESPQARVLTKFKIIEIEADDVDSFAYALLNEFEYETSESWDTYIYG